MDNLSSDRVRDDIFCHHHFIFLFLTRHKWKMLRNPVRNMHDRFYYNFLSLCHYVFIFFTNSAQVEDV